MVDCRGATGSSHVGAGCVFWQKAKWEKSVLGRLEFLSLKDSMFSLFRADSDKTRYQLARSFQNFDVMKNEMEQLFLEILMCEF